MLGSPRAPLPQQAARVLCNLSIEVDARLQMLCHPTYSVPAAPLAAAFALGAVALV